MNGGFLTNFLSNSMIEAFTIASSILIVVSQISTLLGFSIKEPDMVFKMSDVIFNILSNDIDDFILNYSCFRVCRILKKYSKILKKPTTLHWSFRWFRYYFCLLSRKASTKTNTSRKKLESPFQLSSFWLVETFSIFMRYKLIIIQIKQQIKDHICHAFFSHLAVPYDLESSCSRPNTDWV